MIKVIVSYLFLLSCSYGMECSKSSFDIGNIQITEIYEHYNKTVITKKLHEELKYLKISEKNFKTDMKILEQYISFLNSSVKYLNKANNLNKININHWKKLQDICTYENLTSSTNSLTSAQNMKMTIKQQLERVLKYIKRISVVKKIGNERWGGIK
ncbi:MAG: hypothetical protein HRT40_09335 [Campylobacteraceae bacterium]|nr:hypothetical protein [Campylobacteraceae bacterium]